MKSNHDSLKKEGGFIPLKLNRKMAGSSHHNRRESVPITSEDRRRWSSDPPIVQAREIISESGMSLDLQAEVVARVSKMNSTAIANFIRSGGLTDMLSGDL